MISCRSEVYKLVQDLHRIGIVHKDLEPRNIGRTRGGGFCLIDFSESRRHVCRESKVRYTTTPLSPGCLHVNKVSELGTQAAPAPNETCSELRTLRNWLWKWQPLQPNRVNLGWRGAHSFSASENAQWLATLENFSGVRVQSKKWEFRMYYAGFCNNRNPKKKYQQNLPVISFLITKTSSSSCIVSKWNE